MNKAIAAALALALIGCTTPAQPEPPARNDGPPCVTADWAHHYLRSEWDEQLVNVYVLADGMVAERWESASTWTMMLTDPVTEVTCLVDVGRM